MKSGIDGSLYVVSKMRGGECSLILNGGAQLKLSRSRREQIEKILSRI